MTEQILLNLFLAICAVESGNNPNAVNLKENAVGVAQIRPIMVRDVNRICGAPVFGLKDRYDPEASYEMFKIYIKHYGAKTPREVSMQWNGGPKGYEKKSTLGYWRKVQRRMK